MLVIFESLLPIFLMVVIGQAIRRTGLVGDDAWAGMERIAYYLFFPALLFQTIHATDFGQFAAGAVAAGFLAGTAIMLGGMLLMRRPVEAAFALSPASFSSLYQATTRWNGFVILAIAERLAGTPGLAVVAIGLGTMVAPINVVNIAVVTALGDREGPATNRIRQIATNPLILAVLAGLLANFAGVRFYEPLEVTLELTARISLPFGLLLVGAGLKLRLPGNAFAAAIAGTFIKLVAMPAVLVVCGYWFGVRGEALMMMGLCGAGPAAMNGYLVARELGGDAPLFAAMVTLQTIVSFFTIPLVIAALSAA